VDVEHAHQARAVIPKAVLDARRHEDERPRAGPRLRAIVRVSLDPEADARRPARRRGYIAQLLDGVEKEISPDAFERLVGSLTLLFGIDPIVSMRDNGDIDPDRIPDVLAWAAQELVSAALRAETALSRE
jgi:hypothetical protein